MPLSSRQGPRGNAANQRASATSNDDGKTSNDSLPIPYAYAFEKRYWREFAAAVVTGVVMGLAGLGFINLTTWLPSTWGWYPKESDEVDFGAGEWWWVGLTAAAGATVGLVSHVIGLPLKLAGFFVELQEAHVEVSDAPRVVVVSAISLSAGASLGPEAALGCLGGAVGGWWSGFRGGPEHERRENVLSGMAAAMGALFATPVLGVLILAELNERVDEPRDNRGSFMRRITLYGAAAATSFTVYTAVLGSTYLEYIELDLPADIVTLKDFDFEWWDSFVGVLFGVFGAAVGLVALIIVGIFHKLFEKLRVRLASKPAIVQRVLPPLLGGVLYGLIAVACPLTLGSGEDQITAVMAGSLKQFKYTSTIGDYDGFRPAVLLVTALCKAATLGICKGSGFVGGLIFPLLFIGVLVGMAAAAVLQNTGLSWVLSLTCCMVAVPASVVPAPITLVCIVAFSLTLGPYATAPILAAATTAHLVCCGLGILLGLVTHGKGKANDGGGGPSGGLMSTLPPDANANPEGEEPWLHVSAV